MAFPADPLDAIVQLALGADLTQVPAAWSWTDITEYVHMGDGAEITITRGRSDEFSTAAPCRISMTLINQDGRFCPKNPVGAYYGQLNRNTPIRVRVHDGSSYVTQAVGHVDQWPVTWADKSESLCLAPITASGALRRLGQGGTVRSALYRYHAQQPYAAGTVLGYWSCEDRAGSTQIASGVGGQPMVLVGGVEDFAADSSIAGSDPLMTLDAATSFRGYLPVYTSTGETAIRATVKIPSPPAGTAELLRWWTSGSNTVWTLEVHIGSPDRLHLRAYNSLGVEQLGGTGINLEDDGTGASLYGRQLYVAVNLTQDGADIDWQILAGHSFAFDAGTSSSDSGTETSSTVGTLEAIGRHTSANAAGITLGHIAVASDTDYGAGAAGATGFAGESVAIRLAEIAAELDLSAVTSGNTNPAMTTYIGASDATDVVSLLRELETADQGVLFDAKTGGLELLLREDRYNRAVALTLDHDQGQLDWLAPTDDDQQIANDVTVSRTGGSESRAFDAAHIAANGTYASTVEALLFQDTDLRYHAEWRRHLGTVDELRYPTVSLNLAAAPSLLADWLACDIGSRLQVLNPPAGLPPDTIDLHIEGYTEHITTFGYRVELNTSPASPWQVFEVEDDQLGRLETPGSELLVGYDSSTTSLLVANTAAPRNSTAVYKWSTGAEPYDWWIAGERLTVGTMTSQTPAHVATGTAAHGNNASVQPGLPGGSTTTGDLLLVWAAIRNSGTGTVDAHADYETLISFGNCALLGRIHDGTESAPTITFTGGVANATTSAQMASFRYAQNRIVASATQLNGSAQDIATPALTGVDRDGLLYLWLGWKQDDYTSAAVISGGFATEIGEASSTTGDDQSLVWNYFVQGTVAAAGTNSFVITGGASAISRAVVVAIPGDVQTATVTRAVNGVSKAQALGAAVKLWKPGMGGVAL